MMFEWKSIGWLIALLSGFSAKVAFEVSEMYAKGKKITRSFWIVNICSFVVTFVVGYMSRGLVKHLTDNPDVQSGIFAVLGAGGYTLFSVVYRIVTTKGFWERLLQTALSKYSGNNPSKEDENKSV